MKPLQSWSVIIGFVISLLVLGGYAYNISAYAATLGMHVWVGYTDWRHMAPALAGLGLWAGGLYLLAGYMLGQGRPRLAG